MKKTFLIFMILLFVIAESCKKENQETTVYPYHCVADDFECRKGKWANFSASVSNPDTLEFHSPTKFSDYNIDEYTGERIGILYQDYKFDGDALVYYVNYINEPVASPVYKRTTYDATTGIFTVYGNGGQKNQIYEYRRIK